MKKIMLVPLCMVLACVCIASGYVFNDIDVPQEDRELYRAANDNFRTLHPEFSDSTIKVVDGRDTYYSVVIEASNGENVTVEMSKAAYDLYKEGL